MYTQKSGAGHESATPALEGFQAEVRALPAKLHRKAEKPILARQQRLISHILFFLCKDKKPSRNVRESLA